VRPWLADGRSLERLNALARARGLRTESGLPVQFVPPPAARGPYEIGVHETGRIATRPDHPHDWFNALAWLAFPRTKARINAMHAAAIPSEQGRRGRLRDLLTLFDEGGALVVCGDAGLTGLLRGHRWRELFWERREQVRASMRFLVLGHAVLEKAHEPWPGITCKAIFVEPGADADAQAAAWLAARAADATPRELASLPVFGYPGWMPENEQAEFYDDGRYFRPLR
jgi:hypothetical protein